ncbi:MAG TPA: ABC transporter ATP-binding protein [Segeticoccus sp.]|uniref:ABC transporter ATP-binding protein n=1 Tax=Segeticoccus sp. TaxID=2706531 RepID=UPI002D7F144F|nr:ABC transporter ATP-binding protein [Segeticoccus sp.]HET8599552.1 ABC transporter ATP-binding protein [Segeticoccus sp.]
MPDLRFEDVSITYRVASDTGRGDVAAVRGVTLELPAGGTLGIAGESGSGKSTLAMSVLRLLPRNARVTGRVLLGDDDVLSLGWGRLRAVRWAEASVVFQGAMHSLNPVRRVGAQVKEALELHVKDDYRTDKARDARVATLFDQVGLAPEKVHAYPHELSGGQRQRVMIALALACDPDVVIADEPTTALDVVVQAQVLSLLADLVRERGISLLMITHDLSVLASACERIAVMKDGVVLEQGRSREVVTNPQHPYTRALAAAFPVIGDPASRLHPVSRAEAEGSTAPATDAPLLAVGESGVANRQQLPASGGEPQPPGEVLLEARNVSVSFRTKAGLVTAVDDVSLQCRAGEIVALVGQSGSGKTTLARTLLGLHPVDRGQVVYRGQPLARQQKALKDFRRKVQLVLQDPSGALNPKQSVYESVAEGIRIHRLPGTEDELVARALSRAELRPPEQFFSAIPQELSGGQQQRVVIAGALALDPEFLLADEPVASLDASVRGEILALLLRLRRTLGLGALVITHDLGLAWNIADRVLVMYEGRIVEEGTVEDVLLHPQHDYTRTLLAAVPVAAASAG